MQVKLTKDEIVLIGTLHRWCRKFGSEEGRYWSATVFKDIGMNDKRRVRAASLLNQAKLMGREKGKLTGPPLEEGEWVWLTSEGVMAYRANVPNEEWDIVPEWTAEEG